ncbi:MAG: LysR family transcriptional regulator [Gammaproteobacteria bacterium]|nr:MAG: LysR family transcriptional regulator [Gammaproteobacteria bacterium]
MLDAIRIYLAVAETGNLSKVAKARGLAVSSISRKIDSLETELGFKLFNRNSRMVMLTDAGEQFLQRAKNILVELDEAKSSISALNADPKGLLTITAPSSFGRLHVAPAVVSFLKRYPLMDIDLNINDDIVDLSSQRIDVAIRIGTLPDSDLVATQLAPFRRIVCASPQYLSQHGHPASPQELLQHNCLSPAGRKTVPGLWTFAGVNRSAALPVRGNFRANDINSLLLAAIDGIGIVHLATWLVSDMISSGQLIQLFSDARDPSQKMQPAIHAVRLPGRSHATKAQLFISHLKSEFGEPAYWDKPFLNQ